MKFAVAVKSDQTFRWLPLEDFEPLTTRHAEARLWDQRFEAALVLARAGVDGWIEEVEDVAEFRARKDTW